MKSGLTMIFNFSLVGEMD